MASVAGYRGYPRAAGYSSSKAGAIAFLQSIRMELKRYDVGVKNIMWGPDFPYSTSSWPVDYQIGLEALERVGATPSEIERIMWRNAAEMYKRFTVP